MNKEFSIIYYEQFSHLESNLHYLNRYLKLISIFKERNLSKAKNLENHHIFPSSFSGSNKKFNMVYLTLKEHYILHHLLWKSFPGTGMARAFKMMCHTRDVKITARVFEQIKLENSLRQSNLMSGMKKTLEHCQNLSNALLGRTLSEDHCKNIGNGHKGLKHSLESIKKSSDKRRGQKRTPEQC